ncbi:uncharacterized protein [Euwallacea fornicatus]|uniref:uncharacterized protein n=1 Tax=Euwallacea fornicatus TaxID=995702 RepID=UPI00338E2694
MQALRYIVGILALITSMAWCQDDDLTIIYLTDSQPNFTWRTSDPTHIKLSAEPGFQIQVNVTEIDLDGESGDYITIKLSADDDNEDSAANTLIFSYKVMGMLSYLYNHNEVEANYIETNDTNSFKIQFSRVGEALTTTSKAPSTTTLSPMPTASPEESATLTVFLGPKGAATYGKAEIQVLTQAISNMGIEYCNEQNCPIKKPITQNNVNITMITTCPMLWENYENCINLTFSLPIIKTNKVTSEIWKGYQLSSSNLKIMWDSNARKYLKQVGLDIFEIPNVSKILIERLIVFCIIIVTLIIMILIARAIMNKIKRRRRKLSDTISITNEPHNRSSQLMPHYLQELPPLFNTDFPMYTNEQTGTKTYTPLTTSVTEEVEPASLVVANLVNISGKDTNEEQDADA